MPENQKFPLLDLWKVLEAVLSQFKVKNISRPVTVRQWLAFSAWGINQHYSNWRTSGLGISSGEIDIALKSLDEADFAAEYVEEMAGCLSDTAIGSVEYLMNGAGDWIDFFTDAPVLGMGKAFAKAGSNAWSAPLFQRDLDAICSDQPSTRSDYVGINDYTFSCGCSGCVMPNFAAEFMRVVTDRQAAAAGYDSAAAPLKKFLGSDFFAKSASSLGSLYEAAVNYGQAAQQQVSDLGLDEESEIVKAIYEHLDSSRQQLCIRLRTAAVSGNCKRAQAVIAFLLGELKLVYSSFANTDLPQLEWANNISEEYAAYPKTLSVMINPLGHHVLAAVLVGRKI